MTHTLRLQAIRKMDDCLTTIQSLSLMLQQVPDEFLDHEMKNVSINHASMWNRMQPYVSCTLDPLDDDHSFAVVAYNAQEHSWDRATKIKKHLSTLAGRIVEYFYLSGVFGALWPTVHRTLGPADCRKVLVTQEIEVCGDLDESKYVEVKYVD